MRKSVLTACLAVLLVCTLVPAAGAAVSRENAQTYRNAMNNQPAAKPYLVDFDGDGAEELLLVEQEGRGDPSYSVWEGSRCICEKDADDDYYIYLVLGEKQGRYYLASCTMAADFQLNDIYTLSDGRWVLVDDMDSYYYFVGAQGMWNYSNNGSSLTKEEFDAVWNSYAWGDSFTFDWSAADVQAQREAVEKELLAALAQPSSWAQEEIDAAQAAGLIPALADDPGWQDKATRLHFAQLAVRLAETATGETLPAAPADTFADCTALAVRKAYAAGIVNGTTATTFSPQNKLTREQLATMLWRAVDYIQTRTGESTLPAGGSLAGYADAGQVSAYAREAVAALAYHSIMQGTSPTTLSPKNDCTVEQSVILAYRTLEKLV